jgi:hypothetical protein
MQWVHSTDGKLAKGDDRKKIRRQAMSNAARARRQRGNYGKSNVGQLPEDVVDRLPNPVTENSHPGPPADTGRSADLPLRSMTPPANAIDLSKIVVPNYAWSSVPRPMPSVGYELMRMQVDFDVLDLSSLATFHIGQAAARALAAQPDKLSDVLRFRQWSYFNYLPGMYGHDECLDLAVRCVSLRVRHYLGGEIQAQRETVFQYHAAALQSLGLAVKDPVRAAQAEVLCAAEVMAIYELLEFANPRAWVIHIAGASSLLRLRGPKCHNTDFEKALLLALVGPIYTEALISSSNCFLDDPRWKTALAASVLEHTTFSDCSEIIIALWIRNLDLPRLFNDVQYTVQHPDLFCRDDIDDLVERVDKLRTELKSWRESYDILVMATSIRSASEQAELFFDRSVPLL